MIRDKFWENIPLTQMSHDEWEALCDGCAKCCLLKLEDEDTGAIHYTNIACSLLDHQSCRCSNYANRKTIVEGCVILTPANIDDIAHWMPESCAYRRLHRGEKLPDWHPLLTGRANSAHAAVGLKDRLIAEETVAEEDQEDYIIESFS